jgi:hypothetical protein
MRGTQKISMACALVRVLVATGARSQAADDKGFTAGMLYDECTNYPDSSVQRAHCNGFIHGFLIGAMTIAEIAKTRPPFCGGNPEVSSLVTVFQTFIRMRPDALTLEARVALIAAFTTAFPCHGAK